ncbi:MAG: prolyl oligopeptidase family serine peptidase [Candidatus Bathyarchaeia archaeon]
MSYKATAGPDRPQWLPDGSGILFRSSRGGAPNIWKVDLISGLLERLTIDLGSLPFLSASLMACSPDGEWVSYVGDKESKDGRERSSRCEIWLHSLVDGSELRLTRLGANINAYSWSPDGGTIVFSGNRYGRYDVYSVEVPSGETTRLTDDPLYEMYPVFTPSGENILYVRLDDAWADHEIVMMSVSGERIKTVVSDADFFDYHYGRRFGYPLVSPKGGIVVFPSQRTGWINYHSILLDGGEPKPIYRECSDQTDAAFSPDGKYLAFVSNSNGTKMLKVAPVDKDDSSDDVQVLVKPDMGIVSNPAWSPDGTRIAYLYEKPNSPANLWIVNVEGGKPRKLTSSPLESTLSMKLTLPEKIVYKSFDGREISAYLYSPPNREPGERFPGLLYIHGGPTSQFTDTYHPQIQYLIRNGYVVLMPNIRGSSGYGKKFEDLNNGDWGHDDLKDVIEGVNYLKNLDYVDCENIGIHGTSYGGCMCMSAICFAPGIFQAAIPHAGYSDWLDFIDEQELRHRQLLRYEFGDPKNNLDVYRRCSPIYHAKDVTTPTFIVHGEGLPPHSDASLKFARALEKEYKTYEYKVYQNECYYVRSEKNLLNMYQDILDFLNRYLNRARASSISGEKNKPHSGYH